MGEWMAWAIGIACPESRVFGVDSEPVLAHAVGAGAIERGFETIGALPDVSLIVLAAPVRQNIQLLQQIGRGGRVVSHPADHPITITDVGGAKREIVNAARALPPGVTFVGGHPLGGGERGGFAFARPDLFAGRPWIFTPDGDGTADAVERLSRLLTRPPAKP